MSQQKGIGRLIQIGSAKETTRGTTPASATYWTPFEDLTIDEKQEKATDISSYGIIEDAVSMTTVKQWSEGSIQGIIGDQTFGLFLLSIFGTLATHAVHGFETTVYDNIFTVQEGAQHQSLSFYLHDPLTAQDYSYGNAVVSKLEFTYALKQFVKFNATIKGLKGVAQSAYTPATTAENHFVPQYLTLGMAPQIAGLTKVQTATGTASSTANVTALSISTDLLAVGMTVTGANIPAGTTILAIVSATALTLSQSTTGVAADFQFGSLAATGTASSTIHVTALSGITTAKLQVGMTVAGANIPVGATIVKIVSSTAFDLSVATTGAGSYMTFGPQVVAVKSAKITIDQNIEDQEVLGSTSPADFLNKEYKIEGTIEAILQNESDFKTAFLANTPVAMRLDLKNTDVTIGTAANPEFILDLAKCYILDWGRPIKVKDLVYQTLKFKAVYSTGDTEMAKTTLTNSVNGY